MVYALDSSIIIDFLNRESSVITQFNKAVMNGNGIIIPSVVDMETSCLYLGYASQNG